MDKAPDEPLLKTGILDAPPSQQTVEQLGNVAVFSNPVIGLSSADHIFTGPNMRYFRRRIRG